MIAKIGSSVQGFRAQHPRYFLASLVSVTVLLTLLLAGGSPSEFGERYRAYKYPPSYEGASTADKYKHDRGALALQPVDLAAAVRRSEQLWERSCAKRKQFIAEQGGLKGMRMFSDKSWVGYGQSYTLW